jgi:hypothetical protein
MVTVPLLALAHAPTTWLFLPLSINLLMYLPQPSPLAAPLDLQEKRSITCENLNLPKIATFKVQGW